MSNVVRLFRDKNASSSTDDPEGRSLTPIASFVASVAFLAEALKRLSAELDLVDRVVLHRLKNSDAPKEILEKNS